jgi:hypothetical protein
LRNTAEKTDDIGDIPTRSRLKKAGASGGRRIGRPFVTAPVLVVLLLWSRC